MVGNGIITFAGSPWSSKPKFFRKSKSSGGAEQRLVYVFCPLNKVTIKSNYPMKWVEPIINNLMQCKFKCIGMLMQQLDIIE
jgi:hypothetical protein